MKIITSIYFLVIIIAFPCHAVVSPDVAKLKAYEFFGTMNTPLKQNGYVSWSRKKCYHFEGSNSLTIDVDLESGIVRNFGYVKRQSEGKKVAVDLKQAESLSDNFLKKISKTSPLFSGLDKLNGVLHDRGASGKVYNFKWIKNINAIEYPFLIDAEFSAQTGELTSFLLVEYPVTLKDLTPKTTKEQAVEIARQSVGVLEADWKVIAANLSISLSIPQILRWKVKIKGLQRLRYLPERGELQMSIIREIYIDAKTGKILLSLSATLDDETLLLKPPAPRPKKLEKVKLWPTFSITAKEVLFYNWRERERDYPAFDTKNIDDRILAGDTLAYKGLILDFTH